MKTELFLDQSVYLSIFIDCLVLSAAVDCQYFGQYI